MSPLLLQEYEDLEAFFTDIEPHLLLQECKNTFFLLTVQRAMQERSTSHYGSAVWNDQHELVFALFLFSNSILYGSCLLNHQYQAVDLCLGKFIAKGKHQELSWGHAFEPVVEYMRAYLAEHTDKSLKLIDRVCCYDTRKEIWTNKAIDLRNDPATEIKVATHDDRFIVEAWADEFLDEASETGNMIRIPTSSLGIDEQLKEGNIYVMFYDHEPVGMVWKRRPTKNGIAISLVFTPKNKRGKGFASCCVSFVTEQLLKEYQYVTLFVDMEKNLTHNLYTQIGYKPIGEGARFIVEDVSIQEFKKNQ